MAEGNWALVLIWFLWIWIIEHILDGYNPSRNTRWIFIQIIVIFFVICRFIFWRNHIAHCRACMFRINTLLFITCIITQLGQSIIITCVIRVTFFSYASNIFVLITIIIYLRNCFLVLRTHPSLFAYFLISSIRSYLLETLIYASLATSCSVTSPSKASVCS